MSHRDSRTQAAYDEYRASYTGECILCDPQESVSTRPVATNEHFRILPNRFPYSIWDELPVVSHYMIVPMRHITHFTEFSNEEAKEFFRLVTDYEADGYSLYSRAPANTSRTVSHHHAHLIKLATDV